MKKITAIFERRSVRNFDDKEITDDVLYNILQAGTFAPSSGNMQPWEWIVVDDATLKELAVSCTFSGFYAKDAPHQQWIKTAPIIVMICVNLKRTASRYDELAEKWVTIDTANAVQNMILTATENGIGSCWVGGIDEERLKTIFNLPTYVKPLGLLPLGYTTEKVSPKHKMDPMWMTHRNRYNEQYFEMKSFKE